MAKLTKKLRKITAVNAVNNIENQSKINKSFNLDISVQKKIKTVF